MKTLTIGYVQYKANQHDMWHDGVAIYNLGPGCADIRDVLDVDGKPISELWDYRMMLHSSVAVACGCATFELVD